MLLHSGKKANHDYSEVARLYLKMFRNTRFKIAARFPPHVSAYCGQMYWYMILLITGVYTIFIIEKKKLNTQKLRKISFR